MNQQYISEVNYQTVRISDTPLQSQTKLEYDIAQGTSTHAPSLNVQLPVETLTFDQLTQLLIEKENQHGRSTLEMFREYIQRDNDETQDLQEWFDLFFLYMGTRQVRQFSCP